MVGNIPRQPQRMSAKGPLVTVVMPTFGRSQQIGASIQSLLAQTCTDFELLIRDDGDGSDGTAEAVAAAAKDDRRVHYHRNARNLRMPANLNEGILEAQGELIAVCHDHDLYAPSFLATMVDTLTRHPSALFVHCAIEVIAQDGRSVGSHVGEWPELSPGNVWLKFMLSSLSCPVCALTVVRRKAHQQYGLYDPAYGFIADVEMWMRLAQHGDVAYVRHPLIQVREREQNHTASADALSHLLAAAAIHRRCLSCAYRFPESWFRRLLLELRLTRAMVVRYAKELVTQASSVKAARISRLVDADKG